MTWSISTIYTLIFFFLIFRPPSNYSWCLFEQNISLVIFVFDVYVEGLNWHAYLRPKYIKIIFCLQQFRKYSSLPISNYSRWHETGLLFFVFVFVFSFTDFFLFQNSVIWLCRFNTIHIVYLCLILFIYIYIYTHKYSMAEHFQNLDSQCSEVLRYIFNSLINWQTYSLNVY